MCIFTKVFKVDKKHLQYSSTRAKIGSMKQAFKTAGVKKLPPSGFSRLSVLYYTPLQQGKECFPKETLFVLFYHYFPLIHIAIETDVRNRAKPGRRKGGQVHGLALVFAGTVGRRIHWSNGNGADAEPPDPQMAATVKTTRTIKIETKPKPPANAGGTACRETQVKPKGKDLGFFYIQRIKTK